MARTAGSGESTVTILTSGTTGKPKLSGTAGPAWPGQCGRAAGQAAHWLPTYRPDLYAGLQVILQCLLNSRDARAIPGPGRPPPRLRNWPPGRGAVRLGHPSYWRGR